MCPTGWSCADIGNPNPTGDQTLSNDLWTIDASGADITTTADQFRYVWQTQANDGSLSARVVSQSNTDQWAKAGVMLRADTSQGSPYYAALLTPGNGIAIQYRSVVGGGTVALSLPTPTRPIYLKVARDNANFTAYSSTDGITWQVVPGSTTKLTNLSGSLLSGLAVTSHNPGTLSQVTFDQVIQGAVPPPWTDSDIGSPALAGQAVFSGGVATVSGSGWDIWNTTDQFNYVSQPLSGDGAVTARIMSQTNTDQWAKAGVMIKEATAAGSKYTLLGTTPGNGLHFQTNFTGDIAAGAANFPVWVRLTRTGNTFTAARSADGANWIDVGSTSLPMNVAVTAGLFVTAHNGNALSTATFDNISVSATPTATLPAGWLNTDIGGPSLMGSSDNTGGIFNIRGAGYDVWGTADQFQYAYQTRASDSTISARILSQTNTDPWAKAGIMIRDTASPNQPYAFLAVTPSNGAHLQSNFNADIPAGPYTFPVWLRLVRSASTITAFSSSDGINWVQAGKVVLALGASATYGLAVTSHNGNQLGAATFDNVTVTSP